MQYGQNRVLLYNSLKPGVFQCHWCVEVLVCYVANVVRETLIWTFKRWDFQLVSSLGQKVTLYWVDWNQTDHWTHARLLKCQRKWIKAQYYWVLQKIPRSPTSTQCRQLSQPLTALNTLTRGFYTDINFSKCSVKCTETDWLKRTVFPQLTRPQIPQSVWLAGPYQPLEGQARPANPGLGCRHSVLISTTNMQNNSETKVKSSEADMSSAVDVNIFHSFSSSDCCTGL